MDDGHQLQRGGQGQAHVHRLRGRRTEVPREVRRGRRRRLCRLRVPVAPAARDEHGAVNLPFSPPLAPMLSKAADSLPGGDGWQFEPKWDGFRTLVFRDGDEILLQSRDEKPMNRYFPELLAPLASALPGRCVVDGEIVIVGAEGLDFEALLLRIHPAASRVKLLAEQTPASYVVWDLLAIGNEDLREQPLETRRARLEKELQETASVHLSPATLDRALAEDWFQRFEGAGLDGV